MQRKAEKILDCTWTKFLARLQDVDTPELALAIVEHEQQNGQRVKFIERAKQRLYELRRQDLKQEVDEL